MIEDAIPEAGRVIEGKLAAIAPDVLAQYVLLSSHPWWRRRPCAQALRGRVPEAHAAALLDRIRDPHDTSHVRIALLDVLGDRAELLPWLQAQTAEGQDHGVHDSCLQARARLADLTAAPALASLAASARRIAAAIGVASLDVLIAHHGAAAVERAVGSEAEGRMFANRLRSREEADLTPSLADPDVGVARGACELILATGVPDDDHLRDHVVTGPTTEARLWAAFALSLRGHDVVELWNAIDRPRVELPIPEDVRRAILREYPGEARTDPRWLVERACTELTDPPDAEAQLARAIATLTASRLAPGTPQAAGVEEGSGAGTYHQVEVAGSWLLISTLGPFVAGDNQPSPNPARLALEAAGFRWIDATLGAVSVEGLPVYYFGRRSPLNVQTLLFYWQD